MMRLRQKGLREVTCVRTAAYVDATGGLARLETAQRFLFLGLLLPPQKRITRAPSGVRLALAWKLIPRGRQDIREKDHLYFEGDPRCYVVTAAFHYPRHMACHVELAQ